MPLGTSILLPPRHSFARIDPASGTTPLSAPVDSPVPHADTRNPARAAHTAAPRGERLQRVLARAGVAARRECERLIEQGRVEVNGRVVSSLPVFVDPRSDRIEVDGRPLRRQRRLVYVLLNKPPRTLTTARDEPGAARRTVADLVEHPSGERLFPVGRLDYDTLGLVLLTNDGPLAERLTHPRYGIPKTYHAVVRGFVSDDDVDQLRKGVFLADRRDGRTRGASRSQGADVRVVTRDRDRSVIEITLREGRNREVRRLLARVGHPVRKLTRVAMGPLKLKGVARGAWRELTRAEIRNLRTLVRGDAPAGQPR